MRKMQMLAIGMALVSAPAWSDTAGQHPKYLHARADLRAAQKLLREKEEPAVAKSLTSAAEAVEDAIKNLERAAAADNKKVENPAIPDMKVDRVGRFKKILQYFTVARADISTEEDTVGARGWRDKAVANIDHAKELVKQAAKEAKLDKELGL